MLSTGASEDSKVSSMFVSGTDLAYSFRNLRNSFLATTVHCATYIGYSGSCDYEEKYVFCTVN
jgi:hypothetical protein